MQKERKEKENKSTYISENTSLNCWSESNTDDQQFSSTDFSTLNVQHLRVCFARSCFAKQQWDHHNGQRDAG